LNDGTIPAVALPAVDPESMQMFIDFAYASSYDNDYKKIPAFRDLSAWKLHFRELRVHGVGHDLRCQKLCDITAMTAFPNVDTTWAMSALTAYERVCEDLPQEDKLHQRVVENISKSWRIYIEAMDKNPNGEKSLRSLMKRSPLLLEKFLQSPDLGGSQVGTVGGV